MTPAHALAPPDDLVRVVRPRVVAEFAGLRNRVEHPALLAGVHVERANMAGRPGKVSGTRAAEDQQVLEHDAGRAGADTDALDRTIESLAQIDAAAVAKRRDRVAGAFVERPEEIAIADEHAILVHGDAAMPEPRRSGQPRRSGRTSRALCRSPRRARPPSASASWRRARRRRRQGCSASRSPGTRRCES